MDKDYSSFGFWVFENGARENFGALMTFYGSELLKFTLIRGGAGKALISIFGAAGYVVMGPAWFWLWDRCKDSEAQFFIEDYLLTRTSLFQSWNFPWGAIIGALPKTCVSPMLLCLLRPLQGFPSWANSSSSSSSSSNMRSRSSSSSPRSCITKPELADCASPNFDDFTLELKPSTSEVQAVEASLPPFNLLLLKLNLTLIWTLESTWAGTLC